MNAVALSRSVNIETTEENARKLALLLRAVQAGELDGVAIRPPMRVSDMANIIGVSRNALREWRSFDKRVFVMPQPGNLRSIAKNLLGISEVELEQYFQGSLTLKQILEPRSQSHTPEDIYRVYQTLAEPEKDALLALLLHDRAKNLGNAMNKNGRNRVLSTRTVVEDTNVASKLGEGLSPKAAERLQNLLTASRAKHSRLAGVSLDFYEILERLGVDPRPFVKTIDAAAKGQISLEYGPRLFPENWNAIALICFKASGWANNRPTELSDQTYGQQVSLLKRALTENGEPHPVVRQ